MNCLKRNIYTTVQLLITFSARISVPTRGYKMASNRISRVLHGTALWKCNRRQRYGSSADVGKSLMLSVQPEVQDALSSGRPVVALETAIITHGMPYPRNLEVAQMVEHVVRSNGSVPASIGVIGGQVHVGLTPMQLTHLAEPGTSRIKVSRRDFPYALSKKCTGGTTVSGTMLVAHKLGIPLFVTGGIGGVHRFGETTMDVSADLTELGRTAVAVVCAGAKSILDIGRTLEVLETQGVCVATFGEDDSFPAFFTRQSGHKSPYRLRSIKECARMVHDGLRFGSGSGVLIAVPIPEDAAAVGRDIEAAVQAAVKEATSQGISGRDITPFILNRVNDMTKGESLEANVALVKNNADVGSKIAVEVANMNAAHDASSSSPQFHPTIVNTAADNRTTERGFPVVVGGAVFDLTAKVTSSRILCEGTNRGVLQTSLGGVGRNLAEVLARLGLHPWLITAVGKDDQGQKILQHMRELGMSTKGVMCLDQVPTAAYCAVLDGHGEMRCGIGDMDALDHVSPQWVEQHADRLQNSSIVLMDGNIPLETMQAVCQLCREKGIKVLYEPTSSEKAGKFIHAGVQSLVHYATPNLPELKQMYAVVSGDQSLTQELHVHDMVLEEKLVYCLKYLPSIMENVPVVFVKLGCDGVLVAEQNAASGKGYNATHYAPAPERFLPVSVVSVTGAGDSFVGAAAASIIRGFPLEVAMWAGLKAAHLSLLSDSAVSEDINPYQFEQLAVRNWADSLLTRVVI